MSVLYFYQRVFALDQRLDRTVQIAAAQVAFRRLWLRHGGKALVEQLGQWRTVNACVLILNDLKYVTLVWAKALGLWTCLLNHWHWHVSLNGNGNSRRKER
jgi:hypothetical protein